MKASSWIMFVGLPAGKANDKEAQMFQNSLEISRDSYKQLFAENVLENSNISVDKHSEKLKTWFYA